MVKNVACNFLYIALVFIALSCDRARNISRDPVVAPTPPTASTPSTKKANLLLFAGGNCEPCRNELPALQERMKSLEASKRSRITVTVYVTQNATGSGLVTQSYAEQYGKELGLSFIMQADKFGRTYYRKYYPEGNGVPATVIAAENGETQKIYPPGIVDMDVLFNALNQTID